MCPPPYPVKWPCATRLGWAGPGPTQTTCKWDANSRVQQCTRASPVPDTTALHTARVCFTNYFRYTTLTSSWRNVQEWGCCEKIVGDGNWGNFTVEKTETWPRDRISWGGAGVTQCDVWRVTVWQGDAGLCGMLFVIVHYHTWCYRRAEREGDECSAPSITRIVPATSTSQSPPDCDNCYAARMLSQGHQQLSAATLRVLI